MKKINPLLALLIICLIPSISLSITPLLNTPCDSEGTCIEGDCENGEGTWEYSDGKKYVGQFQNGQPNGKGILTLTNGMIINGEFQKGLPHGKGTTTSQDGTTTINLIWENGEMVQMVSSETDYESDETSAENETDVPEVTAEDVVPEVTDETEVPLVTDETDVPEEAGTTDVNYELTLSSEGKCIQGDCVNGYGTIIFPNGKKYVGRFKDKMKHGRGVEGQEGGDGKFGYWLYDMHVGKVKPEELEDK